MRLLKIYYNKDSLLKIYYRLKYNKIDSWFFIFSNTLI